MGGLGIRVERRDGFEDEGRMLECRGIPGEASGIARHIKDEARGRLAKGVSDLIRQPAPGRVHHDHRGLPGEDALDRILDPGVRNLDPSRGVALRVRLGVRGEAGDASTRTTGRPLAASRTDATPTPP